MSHSPRSHRAVEPRKPPANLPSWRYSPTTSPPRSTTSWPGTPCRGSRSRSTRSARANATVPRRLRPSSAPPPTLPRSAARLSTRYRQGDAATSPILSCEADVAAYAGYRMPATYAAVHAVLAEAASRAPGFEPRTQIDVGGGTGAAVWAAAAVWPSLTKCTVLEQVAGAIGLGK